VQIQNGCDHRCTFCVIPFGRGPSRSVPAGEVVAQVRSLAEKGYAEIVLTGVDITAYGKDLPGEMTLGKLVRSVLRLVPELPRLRLSSIDSVEADAQLFAAIAEEERLMPHLHLSLQSGDDLTLKRMKRRHARADSVAFCAAVRRARPDMVFGADLIAGFPTETEAMFKNSLSLVDDCGLTFLHVFPYSAREGTPAARMPQVHGAIVTRRAGELREKGVAALKRHLEGARGRHIEVLMETGAIGRSADFTPVRLEAEEGPGTLVEAIVAGDDGAALIAVKP
jgi:threonylcarbamoyladenosine tRNA methylthiotransferase MtaB